MLAGDTLRSAVRSRHPHDRRDAALPQGLFPPVVGRCGKPWPKPPRVGVHGDASGRDGAARFGANRGPLGHAPRLAVPGSRHRRHAIPVYLLDSDVEPNAPLDREFTHSLYGGDDRYSLCQETILGIGGLQMLQALGHSDLDAYHMNEGHAALLALHLARTSGSGQDRRRGPQRRRRRAAALRVHYAHPGAGRPRLLLQAARRKRAGFRPHNHTGRSRTARRAEAEHDASALECAGYVNGVARIHQGVSQAMFPRYRIRAADETECMPEHGRARRCAGFSTGISPSGGSIMRICATRWTFPPPSSSRRTAKPRPA